MGRKRSKLIIIISLLLIFGFVITSLASYFVSRASVRSQIITNELPLTSDNIYSEIQRDLLTPIFISSVMATNTFLRDWTLQGETDETKIRKFLKDIQTKYGTFTSFFVSDKTSNYYQSEGILKKVSPDEERDRWYYRVRGMKADFEINVDPDMANEDTMTIFINYKVFDYDGNFIGATGVGLAVFAVKELIEKYQNDFERNIYFTDRRGGIVLKGASFSRTENNVFENKDMSSFIGDIFANRRNSFRFKEEGDYVYLNTRYIPELDWYLFVEQTDKKATKNIATTLMINLCICLLITSIILSITNQRISSYQKKIERLAATDSLTGLYNRQTLQIILSEALKDTNRRGSILSVIIFDIDHFKQVNDTYGHRAGDFVLKEVAQVTGSTVRNSDILFRWGGEEFLIVLKDCGAENALKMAEKIRLAILKAIISANGRDISVTVSLGVSQYVPGESSDELIERADRAMYAAKNKGRNRSEIG
jgi:diguanylate cyclase (GGDEF)-like protein